ncbi:phosphatidylinositol 3 [Xylaria palmicola]|nr:phosphatidylinositol 3 [Xylaria palmicola]
MARNIRQQALEKIAALSATSSITSFDRSDLDRLCRATSLHNRGRESVNGTAKSTTSSLGQVPMTIREYEVLIALCKTAPMVQNSQSAQKLTNQLIPYILESHVQNFVPSPGFSRIEPSPNEALTTSLTAALLSLGNNHESLHETVSDNIWAFLASLRASIQTIEPPRLDGDSEQNLEDAIRTAALTISLLGFLDAASAQADFWRIGGRLALVQRIHNMLSDSFLTAIDGAFSTIRNSHSSDRHVKEWKRCLRHYASRGRPLGPMLVQRSFTWLLVAATSLLIVDAKDLRHHHVLDLLMTNDSLLKPTLTLAGRDVDFQSIEMYAGLAQEQMERLEASADFLELASASQKKLANAVRASAVISFLNCSMLNEDAGDPDHLMSWLAETLDSDQISDETLASAILRTMAILARFSPEYAPTVIRLLPRFIIQTAPSANTVDIASNCLAFTLHKLSNDAVISTLYTMGNILSPSPENGIPNGSNGDSAGDSTDPSNIYHRRQSTGSDISLQIQNEEDTTAVYSNIIQTICCIAKSCEDEKITALAQAMLLQKLTKVNQAVDAHILVGASTLSLNSGQLEFRSLLRLYSRICHAAVGEDNTVLLDAVMKARNYISANIKRDSPLFDIYLEYILEDLISKGDIHQSNHMKESDIEFAAQEIAQLLQPLATLMSANDFAAEMSSQDDDGFALIRDAWFNIVAHGFTPTTEKGKKYMNELRYMAIHSPPLVAEQRGEQIESDIELNTVLRRANTSDREAKQKKSLASLVPSKASHIRGLSYRKVIFLQAAYLVESLRADSGDCTKVLSYFLEPSMRKDDVRHVMEGIASVVIETYLDKTLDAKLATFSAHYAAFQLATILCGCCHRIQRVQQAAFYCADKIIHAVPSALCQKSSLFALLELLSLMWLGCFQSETELYDPQSVFTSKLGLVTLELSDDYAFRKATLNNLYKQAKSWVSLAINLAPTDVKGLLQTYLSEFTDEGAYGHMSLGRSFAVEMGSAIPATDQRLTSLDRIGGTSIDMASDFIAQYTTRQEYRYGETLPSHGTDLLNVMPMVRRNSFIKSAPSDTDAVAALAHFESRLTGKKVIPLQDVRDILRRAAALLCRSQKDESAITHYLVTIPFRIFSKESIKFGISLWLGVINENPRMESRLLSEIAQQWEITMQTKLGLFNPSFMHPDPLFMRKEFAPSDNEALAKQRQQVHNLLAPHTQLMLFFDSHFNATRLGSPETQKIFLRLLDLTLDALKSSISHPMAREIRLRILLFSLKVLRVSGTAGAAAQWRLKDKILSAGLSWFKYAPKWSFGSNMLQLKTEVKLISDIKNGLKAVSHITPTRPVSNLMSPTQKESLLEILLESEQARLSVWIHPLNEGHSQRPEIMTSHGKATLEATLKPLIRVAWTESPSLAIELVSRFNMPSVHQEVRWLLLNFPTKALCDADALPILFGGELPQDVRFQLKYLLYWTPVNPVTATTYFLPAYKNHPFLIQYAMRALEYHPIDVTFFYVPQIVQSLRFDALGYVERYIIETAQFSQLFAHQIIWNMKANSYKDDDATIPDAIKPALDTVMKKLVDSFSGEDKSFYEREFAFFDEVTSISGKLKPLIKRDKPEKKQKIEEELRKIQVAVGVYLPSNPDGVVIGIDRKSGKPLQSHAKAPFMATFRIQKTIGPVGDFDETGPEMDDSEAHSQKTVEVWQSAIFKVGDDCRQDVLALQMIAAFRGIFHNVGLDVYVFPYRVTATAPGCGVIDVLPNSISRDMLGREAVNGLYDYFISKYGNEDSLRFQHARNNFVKSMAAYSIISFLLQFKDRHNGNIMIDDAGHILHIDFGFCFDIAPGGVKFERAPFKLTNEMILVMGGSTEHQAFKSFEQLCVKAFLACRPYAEKLSQIVQLMMESGLPCFKPESVEHFKERFVLEKNEWEAAEFVKFLVKKSAGSYSTMVYDQFQLMTNGIPY